MKSIKHYIKEGLLDIEDNINMEMSINDMREWLKKNALYRSGGIMRLPECEAQNGELVITQELGQQALIFTAIPPFHVRIRGYSAGISKMLDTDFLTLEPIHGVDFSFYIQNYIGGTFIPNENMVKHNIKYTIEQCRNLKIDISAVGPGSSLDAQDCNNLMCKMAPKMKNVRFWGSQNCSFNNLKEVDVLAFYSYRDLDEKTVDGNTGIKINSVECCTCGISGIPVCAVGANTFESTACTYDKCSIIDQTKAREMVYSKGDAFSKSDISDYDKILKLIKARVRFDIISCFPKATIQTKI